MLFEKTRKGKNVLKPYRACRLRYGTMGIFKQVASMLKPYFVDILLWRYTVMLYKKIIQISVTYVKRFGDLGYVKCAVKMKSYIAFCIFNIAVTERLLRGFMKRHQPPEISVCPSRPHQYERFLHPSQT